MKNLMTFIEKEHNLKYAIDELCKAKQINYVNCIMHSMLLSGIDKIQKYTYEINSDIWNVYEGSLFKFTVNDSHTYHCYFNKTNGLNIRFGKTIDDDPDYCELGPEIADIEIVTGSCPKISSENCRWCYKNNTSTAGKVMTLEQFKKVINSFPKNLSQVALGITGVKSNPYLKDILAYLREQGIIGNLTLTGADLDDEMTDVLCEYCGACAVSCYDKAKDLC